MADRFYVEAPLGAGEFTLDGPEAHHMATVRRFQPGDRVTLFNGDGGEYPAEILSVQKRVVTLTVEARAAVSRERPCELVIAVAMPKGDRAEFLVEKLTELGVTRLVPLVTERTVVTPKETRLEKLNRIVIEASKQCGRNVLMSIEPPMGWADFLGSQHVNGTKIVLHTADDSAPARIAASQPVTFAVGPEGGFTTTEVETAVQTGWTIASLGRTVLRVETAAIAAAALVEWPA